MRRTLALCAVLLLAGNSLAAPLPGTEQVRGALTPLLPDGVRIDTLTIDGSRSTVHGTSPSNAVLSNFLRSIDSSANFARVELIEIRQDGGRMAYKLAMDITCSTDPAGPCLVAEGGTQTSRKKSGSVYKCQVNGALQFQDRPCAAGTEAP